MKAQSYPAAAARLLAAVREMKPEALKNPELQAVVTHWLQAPDRLPFRHDRQLQRIFLRALGAKRGADVRIAWKDAEGILPFPPPRSPKFTFIDLFAGIGGFRIALQGAGGSCVFSSEWDTSAQETYYRNYGEIPFGDIRRITGPTQSDDDIRAAIPAHDVLAAGFPCQPFSRAGVSARRSLGQYDGFACETQGTLFFDIARIVHARRPRVLLLENVRNLRSHDGGRTLETIKQTITQLGYSFTYEVIDSSSLVPQRRLRCYIVCLRDTSDEFSFKSESFAGPPRPLREALEQSVDESFTISDRLWLGHQTRSARNASRGVGFTTDVARLDIPARTLVARYGKDGKECLVPQPGSNPRMLTPRECANLQGFPPQFRIHPSRAQAYRQFGNSVPVPVVAMLAAQIRDDLRKAHGRAVREPLVRRAIA